MRWLVLGMLCACGRVGFEPLIDGAITSEPGDSGEDAPRDGKITAPPFDAMTPACAAALDVTVGHPVTTSTCVDGDKLEGCGPAATQEVIFKFVVPQTSGYSFAAYDHGTMNVSDSTAQLDSTCTTAGSCAGILGLSLDQGDTLYFIVESSSGGCDTIDFTVTASP